MYKELVSNNPDLYDEENLNEAHFAFIQGLLCTKNALADIVDEFFKEEKLPTEYEPVLNNLVEYVEDKLEDFESEFIVTVIDSYADNK